MPRIKRHDFPRDNKSLKKFMANLPRLAGNTALNFYDDSFTRQGFIDRRFQRWPARKTKDKNKRQRRNILIQSGRLRRSLRMRTAGSNVIIFTDVPYAEAHNEGKRIRGRVTVRSHTRRTTKGKTRVRRHRRKVDFKMPKRQFMGHSELLDKRLELLVTNAIDDFF